MQIVFLFYDGMTTLDAIGPHEILARFPQASVKRTGLVSGPINTDTGLQLIADYSYTEVTHADILLVPGAANATAFRQHPEVLEWLRHLHTGTTWTTSVCTGSLILGAAGLLQGVRATTHWAALERLRHWGAIPQSTRVVEDGKIITAAGVSAGIDMALMLAAKVCGQQRAESMQLGLEYDPAPPFDSGSPAKAKPEIYQSAKQRIEALFEPL